MGILNPNIQMKWGDLFKVTLLYTFVEYVNGIQQIITARPGVYNPDNNGQIYVDYQETSIQTAPVFQQNTDAKRLYQFESMPVNDDKFILDLTTDIGIIFQSGYISLQEINPPAQIKSVVKCFAVYIPDPHIGDLILQGQPMIIFERNE